MRLRIKKPDFLGESQWEFRLHDHRTIAAKITDGAWLTHFHEGQVAVKAGDLLEVEPVTRYVHIPHYATAQIQYTIPRVWNVISSTQLPPSTLFDLPA